MTTLSMKVARIAGNVTDDAIRRIDAGERVTESMLANDYKARCSETRIPKIMRWRMAELTDAMEEKGYVVNDCAVFAYAGRRRNGEDGADGGRAPGPIGARRKAARRHGAD